MTNERNSNTLCWTCKKCYGKNQCDWANFLKPIEGWRTVCGENEDEITRSVDIIFCPEYVRDERALELQDVYNLIADHLGIEPYSVQSRWLKYAKKYQKQMIAEYGSEAQIPNDKRIPEWFWYKDIDKGMAFHD